MGLASLLPVDENGPSEAFTFRRAVDQPRAKNQAEEFLDCEATSLATVAATRYCNLLDNLPVGVPAIVIESSLAAGQSQITVD